MASGIKMVKMMEMVNCMNCHPVVSSVSASVGPKKIWEYFNTIVQRACHHLGLD